MRFGLFLKRLFRTVFISSERRSGLDSLLTAGLLATLLPSLQTGDAKSGQKKAQTCVACHGVNGMSSAPQWPNLAGQKDDYLRLQLYAFKSYERKNTIMNSVVQALSDQDILDLAAYYSSLKSAQ
jgi:cytochrome c553